MDSRTDSTDPLKVAARAAAELGEHTGIDRYDVAVVLGSGWARAAQELGSVVASTPSHEIAGFYGSAVEGHTGTLQAIELPTGVRVLLFAGRTHLYEGHGVVAVVHGMRVAAAAGVKSVVLTNGAGGLREGMFGGQAMLIADHINLTATSPLRGAQFVDLTDVYSASVRERVLAAHPEVTEGVYAQLPGPHYETPAEIRYLRTIGADAVGMSTALEAIAARALGMRVVGVSLITNLAAGMAGPLDHAEVLAAGHAAAEQLTPLLATIIGELNQ